MSHSLTKLYIKLVANLYFEDKNISEEFTDSFYSGEKLPEELIQTEFIDSLTFNILSYSLLNLSFEKRLSVTMKWADKVKRYTEIQLIIKLLLSDSGYTIVEKEKIDNNVQDEKKMISLGDLLKSDDEQLNAQLFDEISPTLALTADVYGFDIKPISSEQKELKKSDEDKVIAVYCIIPTQREYKDHQKNCRTCTESYDTYFMINSSDFSNYIELCKRVMQYTLCHYQLKLVSITMDYHSVILKTGENSVDLIVQFPKKIYISKAGRKNAIDKNCKVYLEKFIEIQKVKRLTTMCKGIWKYNTDERFLFEMVQNFQWVAQNL